MSFVSRSLHAPLNKKKGVKPSPFFIYVPSAGFLFSSDSFSCEIHVCCYFYLLPLFLFCSWSKLYVGTLPVPTGNFLPGLPFDGVVSPKYNQTFFVHLFVLLWSINFFKWARCLLSPVRLIDIGHGFHEFGRKSHKSWEWCSRWE